MNDTNNVELSESKPMDTLAAFICDAEHDFLSVITALQAQVDLLYEEQVRNHMPVERFAILNRAIVRLISDASAIASLSRLAHAPRSKQRISVESLMKEVAAETRSAFVDSKVAFSFDIAGGTTLIGDAAPLKTMITDTVLVLLQKCKLLETLRVVGCTDQKNVALFFDISMKPNECIPSPWRLGELRLIPTNGEGIKLAAVDGMARLHGGELSVSTGPDKRSAYRLIFKTGDDNSD